MHDGLLQQLGEPTEVYERPANLFVAGFIGSPPMNVMPAPLLRLDGVSGEGLIAGLRPESLTEAPADGGRTLDIAVDVVEPLGNETVVHGTLEAGTIVIARLSPRARPEPGSRLTLGFDQRDVHLFDEATGARIDRGASGR